jgi:glycosyltransferase involved in cell wall biosynthesis
VLSVVMPVRNAAPFLDASITSILGQTMADFEFVLLDDASTDGSRDLLRAWARRDARIRLVESDTPLGLAGSANRVMREARGSICARMDADDVSAPDRLARQWAVLEAHPEASVVGTLWRGIDPQGRFVRPSDRWRLWRQTTFAPFPHGSVMFRRDRGLAAGGYRETCASWEDFDFFVRMAGLGPIYVIAKPLYAYRFHPTTATALRALETVERMYQCVDRAKSGRDYTAILEGPAPAPRQPTDPRAVRSLAAPWLWAGERPGIPASWWLRASGHPIPAALHTIALGTWGQVSPKSLRWALRAIVKSRDLAASLWIRDGDVVRWTPVPESLSRMAPALAPQTSGK